MPRMSLLRPTAATGLLLLAAGLVLLLAIGLGAARAATITVAPGDTLGAIAARHGTSVSALARANGIADPALIHAGSRLVVPGGGSSAGMTPVAGSYTVRSGDTLGAIAARHGTSVAALARANRIANPAIIGVGTRLVVPGAGAPVGTGSSSAPASGSHTVRPGDTLGAIASRHGTSIAALAALNGIGDPDVLTVGRVLSIPGGGPGLPSATPTPSADVASLIAQHSARYGVDPALARAVAWQESRWTQSARSSVGAVGVMQIMPTTAKWFGPAVLGRRIDPSRLDDNIEAGVAYLGWLQRQSGSTRTAVGAYYQGLTSLRNRGAYDDTRDYVASVLSFRGRV